ncbi:MAG: serine/threonine protein kinase [Myxococcaceae bacterium]|nr:serine/threonine protein kinase [Myxococcaceae bacterium]
MPPRIIGHYLIHSLLGSGGIGSVYRATDRHTGEDVAIKLLSSGAALDAKAARRMAREFEALFELEHENIVRVFKTGVWHGYPYLTMELVEGVNLRQYLSIGGLSSPERPARAFDPIGILQGPSTGSVARRSTDPYGILDVLDAEPDTASGEGPDALRRLADAIDEPLTMDGDEDFFDDDRSVGDDSWTGGSAGRKSSGEPGRARVKVRLAELNAPERMAKLKDALLQICQALAYVHGRGLIHRDIKPSNIMVDGEQRVKLMDFGLAKHLASDSEVTATGHIVGTYRYMAPEQLRGERIDGRTDLYALGVLLYEQLAGRPPFDGPSTIEVCKKILEDEPTPLTQINSGVDEALARVTHWLLAKDVEERIQTAEELYELVAEA